ncbi:MAG: hypothetical protein C0478_12165 [Planctomyces sp.]|nr:hypothetical protein [Planctomyces sp.]
MARRPSRPLSVETLLDEAGEPAFLVGPDRRLVFINRALEELSGFDKSRLLGETLRFTSSPEVNSPAAFLAALAPPPNGPAVGETHVAAVYVPRLNREPLAARITFWNLGGADVAAPLYLGLIGRIPRPLVERPGLAQTLHAELAAARFRWRQETTETSLIGEAPLFRKALRQAELAARTLTPLLLVGESGTGKEHLARSIHQRGELHRRAFVPLDCRVLSEAAVVEAIERAIEAAQVVTGPQTLEPGSLLLKSIEAATPDIWRLLGTHLAHPPVGETPPLRWMASSNLSSNQLLERGAFDKAAVMKLSTLEIHLPPLRERERDGLLLAQYLLEEGNRQEERQLAGWSSEVQRLIGEYNWPGNVAELVRFVNESRSLAKGAMIQAGELPAFWRLGCDAQAEPPRSQIVVDPLDAALENFEREQLRRALELTKGNRSKAADLLGIPRPRLYRRMEQLGLETPPT